MSSKKLDDQTKSSPSYSFNLQEVANRIIKDIPRPRGATLIRRLKIKQRTQENIPLGSFTTDREPKGILVEIDPEPENSVVKQVIGLLGESNRYSLHLCIANYSSKTVEATIWQL